MHRNQWLSCNPFRRQPHWHLCRLSTDGTTGRLDHAKTIGPNTNSLLVALLRHQSPPCGGLNNVGIAPPSHLRPQSLSHQLALPLDQSRPKPRTGGFALLDSQHVASQPLSLDAKLVKPTLADSTTMLALHKQLKSQHLQTWLNILDSAGSFSGLYASTADSANATLHRTKVVARYAPSTLAAYLKAWDHWTEVCKCSGICPFRPTVLAVADFLQVSSKKSTLGVATAQSRA